MFWSKVENAHFLPALSFEFCFQRATRKHYCSSLPSHQQQADMVSRRKMVPLFFVTLIFMHSLSNAPVTQAQTPLMPAMFVFGDSLVDPGNNNYILTLAKANFPPNGVDFPGSVATGRFCNGRTVSDVIAQLMNLPFLPPYLAPSSQGAAILRGLNYASAAGGILDGTGANYIGRIGLNQQIRYYQNTQQQFRQLLTPAAANVVLAKALYYITIGSNDYLNNYLLPDSPTRPMYTPQQYQNLLVSEFSKQLVALYNLGARKIFVFNVGPLGCIPSQLANQRSPDGKCIQFINGYVQGFNSAMGLLLNSLSAQYPDFRLVYGNAYDQVIEKLNNPGNYGLTVTNVGCCGLGQYNGQVPCITGVPACQNRDQHLFWDPFHPSDAVNVQLGNAFFTGPPSIISPVNIQQLAAMP